MARIELPESKLRARRRKRRFKMLIIYSAAIFIFFVLFVWLAHASFWRVSTIDIKGVQTLSSTTVKAQVAQALMGSYWLVFPKDNIVFYPGEEAAAALVAEFPVIKTASVHTNGFTSVGVDVVERTPRALWCGMGSTSPCLLMDEDAVAYATAPSFDSPTYVTYTGTLAGERLPKHYLTSEEFKSLSALVDAVAQLYRDEKILYVSVNDEKDARVYFKKGFILLFSLKDASGDVFERLTLAQDAEPFKDHTLSEFEYLDLRFGDKLYYKLK